MVYGRRYDVTRASTAKSVQSPLRDFGLCECGKMDTT